MNILIINGPNLNMLGTREKSIYGSLTLEDINTNISEHFKDVNFNFLQSNLEGDIVTFIQSAKTNDIDGIVLNAGAYTHYSIAILDAIKSIDIPVIEVHMSNVHKREEFRHKSVISCACKGVIAGFGQNSYILGVQSLLLG